MLAVFGNKLLVQWKDVPPKILHETWAEALGGYSAEELRKGLAACLTLAWPPTLPEFLALCRPPVDYEATFCEAVRGITVRHGKSGDGSWSHPAIYWAAAKYGGFDIRSHSYEQGKVRWKRLLDEEMEKGEWKPVPKILKALPIPVLDENVRIENLRKIRSMLQPLGINV
jgi:hypothetical protein